MISAKTSRRKVVYYPREKELKPQVPRLGKQGNDTLEAVLKTAGKVSHREPEANAPWSKAVAPHIQSSAVTLNPY